MAAGTTRSKLMDQFINDIKGYSYATDVKILSSRVFEHYPDVKPSNRQYAHPGTHVVETLITLEGTIGVNYKGSNYNIPICIYLPKGFPSVPPTPLVIPTATMQIKPSKFVDSGGKVYMPYLHEWSKGNSDLVTLIQTMGTVFSETPPVFAKSASPIPPPRATYPAQTYPGPPTRATGYPPVPNTGYPPVPNTGYPPVSNTGYPPVPNTGYPPNTRYPPTSGAPGVYPPTAVPTSAMPGYPPRPGYPPTATPGYPPTATPGYPPTSTGYPPMGTPGYPPRGATTGYPPMGTPGYPPQANTGYPPAGTPGYPPTRTPGYPPAGTPGYPPHTAAPGYPPTGNTGYPGSSVIQAMPQPFSGSSVVPPPYSSNAGPSYPPTTTGNYGYTAPTQAGVQYAPQEEQVSRARKESLVHAVHDKVSRHMKDLQASSNAELKELQDTNTKLQEGQANLKRIMTTMERQQQELELNITQLTNKNDTIVTAIETIKQQKETFSVDDAIKPSAPLYNQILTLYARQCAIEDTLFYLGDGLKKKVITLEEYLTNVRELAIDQYKTKTLLKKATAKAGFA